MRLRLAVCWIFGHRWHVDSRLLGAEYRHERLHPEHCRRRTIPQVCRRCARTRRWDPENRAQFLWDLVADIWLLWVVIIMLTLFAWKTP